MMKTCIISIPVTKTIIFVTPEIFIIWFSPEKIKMNPINFWIHSLQFLSMGATFLIFLKFALLRSSLYTKTVYLSQ